MYAPADSRACSYSCRRIGAFLPQALYYVLCLCGMKLTGIQPTQQKRRLSQICIDLQDANTHYGRGRSRGSSETRLSRLPVTHYIFATAQQTSGFIRCPSRPPAGYFCAPR